MSSQSRIHFIPGVKETLKKDKTLNESSIPCKIGSKITLEEYNNFLMCKESSRYKFQQKNNSNIYVIDMSNPEHFYVVSLLQDYFKAANGKSSLIHQYVLLVMDVREFLLLANRQNIGQLIEKCQNWLNIVHVRYVLGIKFHDKSESYDDQGLNQVFWDPPTIPVDVEYMSVVTPAVTLANFTID
ncbi:993_t:CDS:2, partial [Funneliformis geosporum]